MPRVSLLSALTYKLLRLIDPAVEGAFNPRKYCGNACSIHNPCRTCLGPAGTVVVEPRLSHRVLQLGALHFHLDPDLSDWGPQYKYIGTTLVTDPATTDNA